MHLLSKFPVGKKYKGITIKDILEIEDGVNYLDWWCNADTKAGEYYNRNVQDKLDVKRIIAERFLVKETMHRFNLIEIRLVNLEQVIGIKTENHNINEIVEPVAEQLDINKTEEEEWQE